MPAELADVARSVIDADRYMALGTADGAGDLCVSPVWFACEDYRNFHDRGSGVDRSERVLLD
jgi:hypothetical protein